MQTALRAGRPGAMMAQHGLAPAQESSQHSPAQNPPSTEFCAGAGKSCADLRCALTCAVRWPALTFLRWACAGAGLRWRWPALRILRWSCAGAGLRCALGCAGAGPRSPHSTGACTALLKQSQTYCAAGCDHASPGTKLKLKLSSNSTQTNVPVSDWHETQLNSTVSSSLTGQFCALRCLGASDPALGLRWRWAVLCAELR